MFRHLTLRISILINHKIMNCKVWKSINWCMRKIYFCLKLLTISCDRYICVKIRMLFILILYSDISSRNLIRFVQDRSKLYNWSRQTNEIVWALLLIAWFKIRRHYKTLHIHTLKLQQRRLHQFCRFFIIFLS